MKIFAAAFCALNIALFFPSALYPQRAAEQPKFRVEIHPAEDKRPDLHRSQISAANRCGLWFLKSLLPRNRQENGKEGLGHLLDSRPPIEPGASISRPLSEFAFSPQPDQIKVIAAVWTDGETWGAPASVNLVLNNRTRLAAEYEDAAAFAAGSEPELDPRPV